MISLSSPPHDKWAGQEDNRRQSEGKPETDIFLSVDHADLTNQSSDVDKQVEVMVDPALSDGRVDDHTLPRGEFLDDHGSERDLLNDQGRNVGLECTSTETHDDQSEHENTKAGAFVNDYRWNGRDNQDNVADDSDADCNTDGLVTTPVLISNVSCEQWDLRNG